MKHILFISHTARLEAGTSRALLRLLKYLRTDYEPIVVVDTLPGDLPRELHEMDIPCLCLPLRTSGFLPTLIYTIVKEKIDLVYGNGFNGRSMIGLIASKITGRPFICHIHETLSSVSRTWWLHYARVIIANSEDTANHIREYTRLKNIIIVPNGVEISEYSVNRQDARSFIRNELNIAQDSTIIINVGSITTRKNQLHAIQVAAKVICKKPDSYFIFLGAWQEKEYVGKIFKKISELNITENVRVVGFKKNAQEYMAGADILLHTSVREPQGQIILEAMASRLPVVAYEIGGVGEAVVQGKTGYLHPFGDIDGLAADVIKLLEDAELRRIMGTAGYLRVQEYFTSETTAFLVKNVIDKRSY